MHHYQRPTPHGLGLFFCGTKTGKSRAKSEKKVKTPTNTAKARKPKIYPNPKPYSCYDFGTGHCVFSYQPRNGSVSKSEISTQNQIKINMEYQVTKPSFVRFNWTQTLLTFAACFIACLLAGGCIYAVIYFIHRKQNAKNDLPTQTQQQRPVREKRQEEIGNRQKEPQNHQESDQAENLESQDQEKDSQEADEKEPITKTVQLNGQVKKTAVKK